MDNVLEPLMQLADGKVRARLRQSTGLQGAGSITGGLVDTWLHTALHAKPSALRVTASGTSDALHNGTPPAYKQCSARLLTHSQL